MSQSIHREMHGKFWRHFVLMSALLLLSISNSAIAAQPDMAPHDIQYVRDGADAWSMYMHTPERTGFIDASIPATPVIKWNASGNAIALCSMVSDGRYAYTAWLSGNVSAFLVESGIRVWTFQTSSSISSTPVIVDDYLVVGDTGGTVYFIERYSGSLSRFVNIGHAIDQHMLCIEGKIVLAGETQMTEINTSGEIINTTDFGERIAVPPAAYLGYIYIATTNKVFSVLNGCVVWTRNISESITALMCSNNKVIITTDTGTVFALDARSGASVWKLDTGCPIYAPPCYYNGALFITVQNGTLYSISINEGTEYWNTTLGAECMHASGMNRDTLIVPAGNTLFFVAQRTGQIIRNLSFDFTLISGVSIVSGYIFVQDNTGNAYCLAAPVPELKIATYPSSMVVYERYQLRISLLVYAGTIPAVNATIMLAVSIGSLSVYTGNTDPNGAFNVVYTAPPASKPVNVTLSLIASYPNYQNTTKNFTITVLPSPKITLVMQAKNTTLEGGTSTEITLIVYRDQTPVANARVYISTSAGSTDISEGFTDKNGTFQFTYTAPNVNNETLVVLTARAYGTMFLEKSCALELRVVPASNAEHFSTMVNTVLLALILILVVLFGMMHLKMRGTLK